MKTLGPLLAAILCTRCATAIHGRYQSVPVASVPPGASIAVACDRYRVGAGVTPANVVLPRAAEGCSVTLTRPGYDRARVWFELTSRQIRFAGPKPSLLKKPSRSKSSHSTSVRTMPTPMAAALERNCCISA
jgi:hypothetical protein